jgi:hypothetical protein
MAEAACPRVMAGNDRSGESDPQSNAHLQGRRRELLRRPMVPTAPRPKNSLSRRQEWSFFECFLEDKGGRCAS